jgi:hypothetical protein
MPFGPTNWPVTFINFILNIDSVWRELAQQRGIQTNKDTNTKIIMDDIVSWADRVHHTLAYMRCQLQVYQAYNLSLNLCKSYFFPAQFEFVGVDVCKDGNDPAQSKHSLLKTWPAPEFVRDVAKLIGFAQFYAQFILNFEILAAPLRTVCK